MRRQSVNQAQLEDAAIWLAAAMVSGEPIGETVARELQSTDDLPGDWGKILSTAQETLRAEGRAGLNDLYAVLEEPEAIEHVKLARSQPLPLQTPADVSRYVGVVTAWQQAKRLERKLDGLLARLKSHGPAVVRTDIQRLAIEEEPTHDVERPTTITDLAVSHTATIESDDTICYPTYDPQIDYGQGGIMEGDVIMLTSPPKTSKTRRSRRMLLGLASNPGVQALVWVMEGSAFEWETALRIMMHNDVLARRGLNLHGWRGYFRDEFLSVRTMNRRVYTAQQLDLYKQLQAVYSHLPGEIHLVDSKTPRLGQDFRDVNWMLNKSLAHARNSDFCLTVWDNGDALNWRHSAAQPNELAWEVGNIMNRFAAPDYSQALLNMWQQNASGRTYGGHGLEAKCTTVLSHSRADEGNHVVSQFGVNRQGAMGIETRLTLVFEPLGGDIWYFHTHGQDGEVYEHAATPIPDEIYLNAGIDLCIE